MKYYIEVYGCTANQSDASLVKGILYNKGHTEVETVEQADILILLTCTVIGTTEQRMLSRIKKLKKTGKKIIISGCMPAVQSHLIKKIDPDSLQIKPTDIQNIIYYLDDKKNITDQKENKTFFPKRYDDIFAPIMISEGCIFSCSYCITSKARGKLKSFPVDQIKNKIIESLEQDCREIRITAQDTASYGIDIDLNLGILLNEITKIEGDYKIRVGMMNPFTLQNSLSDIIKSYQNPKIYKFFHIPVQSGSNKILEKMDRKYTLEDFKKIVKTFRKKYSDITLATDIIVGFPQETDQDFQKTISLLKDIKPDITNITRFSPRPLTKAKKMKEKIDTNTAKKRSKILSELCKNISKENNQKLVGRNFEILLTKIGKNNTLVGRNNSYKPVVIKEKNFSIGQIVNVEIIKAEDTYLVGNI